MRRRLLILTAVLFLITGAAYLYVASGRLHQRVRLALAAPASPPPPAAGRAALRRRRGALRSIAEITLLRPEINLEISSAGHWNVFDLFARPGEPSAAPAAFTPVVTLVDGRVTVTDFSGPPHPFRARLVEVNGRADLRRPPAVRLAFDLVSGHDDRRTPITVRGKYLLDRVTLDVDLTAAGAPPPRGGAAPGGR